MSKTAPLTPLTAWSQDWKTLLASGPIAIGLDLATTTKQKSNPSAIAVTQREGNDFIVRSVARWKTDNPKITTAMVRLALDLPRGLRARRVVVDATNERFFATTLRTEISGLVMVDLMVASESIEIRGEKMSTKAYLGNLVVNTATDGHLLLPGDDWLADDLRSVEGTTFHADVDASGNHADCFCAIANSLHGLGAASFGPSIVEAATVGTWQGSTVHSHDWIQSLPQDSIHHLPI